MNIYQKLVEVRKSVPYLQKEAQGHQYQYTGSSQVLAAVRQKLDDLGLYLTCDIVGHNLIDGKTAKGGREVTTELDLEFTWVNAENPEEKVKIKWYGQGVDNSEKGVGKALTYAEKYFMLKQFNIATDKDDPDAFQQKAESYRQPEPITQEQLGKLKMKVLELTQLSNADESKIYSRLKIKDLTQLTAKDLQPVNDSLDVWIKQYKKAAEKAKETETAGA